MNHKDSLLHMLPLAIFPMVELMFISLSIRVIQSHPLRSVGLLGIASMALCFSVHITFHEAVHQKFFAGSFWEFATDSVITLLMGLPFHGYRWHHFNHHRHNNTLEDYSCTWERTESGTRPQIWWKYVLGWPAQLWRSKKMMDQEESEGKLPPRLAKRMTLERGLILTFIMVLAWLSWRAAIDYILLVYLGWAWVALENYAQHPPIEYGMDTVTSYYDAIYNFLFCKNGFHAEHHRTASLPWFQLRAENSTYVISKPYLLQPLFRKPKAAIARR